MHGETVKFSG